MPPTWIPLQAQTFQYLEACDVSTMSGGLQQTRSQAQSIEVIDSLKLCDGLMDWISGNPYPSQDAGSIGAHRLPK